MAYEQTSSGRRIEQLAGIGRRRAPLAMISDVLSYLVQAVRWQLLLKSVGKIELSQAAGAPRRRFSPPKLVTPDEKRVYSSRVR
jgi:hypothetical protein